MTQDDNGKMRINERAIGDVSLLCRYRSSEILFQNYLGGRNHEDDNYTVRDKNVDVLADTG